MASVLRLGDRNCNNRVSLSIFGILQFGNDIGCGENRQTTRGRVINGSIDDTLIRTRVSKDGSLTFLRIWKGSDLCCSNKYFNGLRIEVSEKEISDPSTTL